MPNLNGGSAPSTPNPNNPALRAAETSLLLDTYAPLLTERQRALLRLHFEEDLSLAEIARQTGTTRQAAHDAIARGERQLAELETALGFVHERLKLFDTLTHCASILRSNTPNARELALTILEEIIAQEGGDRSDAV
ncbi:MAG: DNA-binding protein [Oscillospiraceae bacterium]|nr:DNA-binding protein [Oscillospiraceae bacterium]